jgi:hypothetical protein
LYAFEAPVVHGVICIRVISRSPHNLTTGTVSVVVNSAAVCASFSPAGTPATLATLDHPHGVAVDAALDLL